MFAPSDSTLLGRAHAGQAQAFGRLVQRYQSLVCGVAYCRTGSTTLSEDVAQETFLIAWRKLGDIADTPDKFAPWLCGIARNLARATGRKRSRRPTENPWCFTTAAGSPFANSPR